MRESGWPFGNRPKPQVAWELWKTGRIMSCEINEHPLGFEIRCYLRGDFYYSQVHPSRESAEAEAATKKRELTESRLSRTNDTLLGAETIEAA